jgi:hypothetical protein
LPVFVPLRFEPVTEPVAATLVGVIAPSVRLIAGVVVGVATVPDTPLAVVTDTLVTLPTSGAESVIPPAELVIVIPVPAVKLATV